MYEPEPEPEPTAPVTFGEAHSCEHEFFFCTKYIYKNKNYISEY